MINDIAGITINGATIRTGSGSPEGVVYGKVGNLYIDTNESILYKKVSGNNTNTGWS